MWGGTGSNGSSAVAEEPVKELTAMRYRVPRVLGAPYHPMVRKP